MDSYRYGGIDLRDKVVAARAFWAGLDPYQDEWATPTSDWFLIPIAATPVPAAPLLPPWLYLDSAHFLGCPSKYNDGCGSYCNGRLCWPA